jgi:hypothetical protein
MFWGGNRTNLAMYFLVNYGKKLKIVKAKNEPTKGKLFMPCVIAYIKVFQSNMKFY